MPRKRPSSRTRAEWVDLAIEALEELLDAEDAAVWDEIEAKVSDHTWPGMPHPIDPHHLTTAKLALLAGGAIEETTAATRGGRPISVLSPVSVGRGRATAIRKASARKRLLQARYQRWGFGDKSTAAILGPAGETVVRESIRAASPEAGYRLVTDGQVRRLFGENVTGGPLDSAAYLPSVDENGIPGRTITVPVEVKNRRTWIYPNSPGLYQLLFKSAALQAKFPDQPLVPVLVCRRHHITAQWMAAELGFFVVSARAQFIRYPADAEVRLLDEVRDELGYTDLTTDLGPNDEVRGYLARGLPKIANRSAERWSHFGPALKDHFRTLRREIDQPERSRYMEDLREAVRRLGGEARW